MALILFLLPFLLLSSGAMSSADPVLDVDGDAVQRGQPYNVSLLVLDVDSGGVKLVSPNNNNSACPLYPDVGWFDVGEPLAFFPEDPNEATVREGNTLYIMFPQPTRCPESTVWRVVNDTWTTGGTTSSTPDTHDSRFAISKLWGQAYYFDFCPCSIGANRPSCKIGCDLDVNLVRDKKLLRALRDKKLLRAKGTDISTGFVFKKAKGAKESVITSAASLSKI